MATMDAVRNSFRNPGLQRRLLITLGLLIVFRVGAIIPVPGIDVAYMESILSKGGAITGLYNLISGGAFRTFSIFAMSIIPYINSSIIMQLLTIVIPRLEEWSKEGEEGRKKISQWTRYGSVILGLIQAIGLTIGLARPAITHQDLVWFYMVVIVLTLTAGSAFLMWLGEQVTEKGIGNGISLIIFSGIVSRIPHAATAMIEQVRTGSLSLFSVALVVVFGLVAIGGVIFVLEGVRKIPIQYPKRVVGRRVYGGQQTFLPMKINQAGVIPVIFAQSLILFPQTIAQFTDRTGTGAFVTFVTQWLTAGGLHSWLYWVLYLALIFGFTYFYTSVTFNPKDVAENLRKQGAFIPGIRPGSPTIDYLMRLSNRITFLGALFLAVISAVPVLIISITGVQNAYLGGTSLLIVVGVGLETMKQLQAQLVMRHYQGFTRG